MGYKMKVFASLVVVGFLFSGCSEDDVKDLVAGQTNPVPGPTANLVTSMVPEAMLGVVTAILPGGTGIGAASLSAQILPLDKACGNGGSVVFTGLTDAGFTSAAITNCADENGNIVVNGTATGTFGGIDGTCDLPTSMNATFDGTAVVEGNTLTFTNFGVNATSISYGPDCDLDGTGAAIAAALTGTITGSVSGADLTIALGSTLNVDVTSIIDTDNIKGNGLGREVTMSIDGTITVDTPCQSGSLVITTIMPLKTAQPKVCPVEGIIDVAGSFGAIMWDYSTDGCSLAACAL